MCTFILKSYSQKSEIKNPHFFILNKGNNSGKPLPAPCPNCLVISFKSETEKEQVFWLCYSLWQSGAFYPYLRGSVIPFVVIRDVRECLVDGFNRASGNPVQFEKAVAALRNLEALEKQFRQNLALISKTRKMLFYRYL